MKKPEPSAAMLCRNCGMSRKPNCRKNWSSGEPCWRGEALLSRLFIWAVLSMRTRTETTAGLTRATRSAKPPGGAASAAAAGAIHPSVFGPFTLTSATSAATHTPAIDASSAIRRGFRKSEERGGEFSRRVISLSPCFQSVVNAFSRSSNNIQTLQTSVLVINFHKPSCVLEIVFKTKSNWLRGNCDRSPHEVASGRHGLSTMFSRVVSMTVSATRPCCRIAPDAATTREDYLRNSAESSRDLRTLQTLRALFRRATTTAAVFSRSTTAVKKQITLLAGAATNQGTSPRGIAMFDNQEPWPQVHAVKPL